MRIVAIVEVWLQTEELHCWLWKHDQPLCVRIRRLLRFVQQGMAIYDRVCRENRKFKHCFKDQAG